MKKLIMLIAVVFMVGCESINKKPKRIYSGTILEKFDGIEYYIVIYKKMENGFIICDTFAVNYYEWKVYKIGDKVDFSHLKPKE